MLALFSETSSKVSTVTPPKRLLRPLNLLASVRRSGHVPVHPNMLEQGLLSLRIAPVVGKKFSDLSRLKEHRSHGSRSRFHLRFAKSPLEMIVEL